MLVTLGSAADPKKPVIGYDDLPFLPDGWRVHDIDRPQPEVVKPGPEPGAAPSDAIVLFDGSGLDAWTGTKQPDLEEKRYNPKGEALWVVRDGYVECTMTGDILTKQAFGDCQLHIEWMAELPVSGHSQGRSNSGIFLMNFYEVQVLDSYDNRTYADGSAGAIYGQAPPMVNANRKPGVWQSYDIIFQAPRFKGKKLVSPAYVTVFLNGVLIHHKTELIGKAEHKKVGEYSAHPEKLPLRLQDHNNKVRFRNIWIRELDLIAD